MRIIENGLRVEDLVVVSGNGHLRPGDTVEPGKQADPKRYLVRDFSFHWLQRMIRPALLRLGASRLECGRRWKHLSL
jgi:hypothetical protein